MSHVSKIEVEITNLETLKKACKNLGLEFKDNQKTYAWYGKHIGDYPLPEGFTVDDVGKCDHAISVPNAEYELGVVKNKNKAGYSLLWDFWRGGSLEERLGRNAWKLVQEYTIQQGIYSAKLEGHTYKVEELKDRKRLKIYIQE